MSGENQPSKRSATLGMQRYLPLAAGTLILSKGLGDFIISTFQLKDPVQASLAFGTVATVLCFAAMYAAQKDEPRKWRPMKRGLVALAFGAVAGGGMTYLADRDARYIAERAAMPRIDAATVIETRPVTIADKYCHPNNRGIEITIEHEGKKMLTMCPR